MRLIFIGDVVGKPGRNVVARELPLLKERYKPDLVVLNGENSAGGFGISEAIYEEFLDMGADVVTLGNHAWDQKETLVYIERTPALLRPVNFPDGTPGKGSGLFETKSGKQILVINAMGRVFMGANLDDPFAAIEKELAACPLGTACDAILIDFHAETGSEKMAMAHFVDGRASFIVGTHTHIPTCDHQIYDGGTAYQSDAGMCGSFNGILGMDTEESLNRFLTQIPRGRFSPAVGPGTLCGTAVELDDKTGLAKHIGLIRLGGRLSQARPEFWD